MPLAYRIPARTRNENRREVKGGRSALAWLTPLTRTAMLADRFKGARITTEDRLDRAASLRMATTAITWERVRAIFDDPQPPKVVWERQFNYCDDALRRLAQDALRAIQLLRSVVLLPQSGVRRVAARPVRLLVSGLSPGLASLSDGERSVLPWRCRVP